MVERKELTLEALRFRINQLDRIYRVWICHEDDRSDFNAQKHDSSNNFVTGRGVFGRNGPIPSKIDHFLPYKILL